MVASRSFTQASLRVLAVTGVIFVLVLIGRLWTGGYLDRDPIWRFPAQGRPAPVSVLYFSGDAGIRFGMGNYMAHRFPERGIDFTALSTSTVFRLGGNRAKVNAVVAGAVRDAEKRAGARPVVLIGQSYGADILQTGLAALPRSLRFGIGGVVLIVPGTETFFRADPLGILYGFRPDSVSTTTLRRIDWVPLTCIHGIEETDSVCPLLKAPNVTSVGLPGGHVMHRDAPTLAAAVLKAIERATPVADARR